MPELPEVETTRRGILPHAKNRTIDQIIVRTEMMRAPLDKVALKTLCGHTITTIDRRGKHLIVKTDDKNKALHLHLGMSGSLRITSAVEPFKRHDHVIVVLRESGTHIRLHDPRKFGGAALIDPENLPTSLSHLGLEPLEDGFSPEVLAQMIKNRRMPIKTFIMDQKFVVGVGNIYATEALFYSNILPHRAAGTLTFHECEQLVSFIRQVLKRAIERGGTTLRDFTSPDGTNGYFVQELSIYGKSGLPCPKCGTRIQDEVIGGRRSAYCLTCQK